MMNAVIARCKSSRYLQCAAVTTLIVALVWLFTDVFESSSSSFASSVIQGGATTNDQDTQSASIKCVLPTGMRLLTTGGGLPSFRIACPDVSKDTVCQSIEEHGHWERGIVYMLQDILFHLVDQNVVKGMPVWRRPKASSLYLDVGGNVGYLAFSMASAADRVVVIEGSPRNAAALRHTKCANNFSHVGIFNYAVGEQSDQKCVLMSGEKNINDYQLKCDDDVYALADGKSLADSKAYKNWPRDLKVRHHVTLTTIDDILDREVPNWRSFPVKIMKIDIEGFELPAVKGARKLFSSLDSAPHAVVMEQFKTNDVVQLLRVMQSYNYTVVSLHEHDGGVVLAEHFAEYHKAMSGLEDFLFLRNDVAKSALDALSVKAARGKKWPPAYLYQFEMPRLLRLALKALGFVVVLLMLVWCARWVKGSLFSSSS